jgi:hypothetical protein
LKTPQIPQAEDFDGGSSGSAYSTNIAGGSSVFPLDPNVGGTGSFHTKYINIALEDPQWVDRIQATFTRFNEPTKIRFIKESLDVVNQSKTMDFLDLKNFFHPLQSFSDYQKQTIIISPNSSFNLDPGSFYSTNGEISMLIARAYYLPEVVSDDQVLFWDYKGTQRYTMGKFMVLTGAIKDGSTWRGWDVNPFDSDGMAYSSLGGFIFTNPTAYDVKLTIIIAN